MRYRIVRSGTLTQLEELVDALVLSGWSAAGGPFWDGESRQWAQALESKVSETLKS